MSSWSPHIQTFRQQLTQALASLYGPEEAQARVLLLLEHLTGWSRIRVQVCAQEHFGEDTFARAQTMARALLSEVPLQYLIGSAHFYGRDFTVNPAVLIPRPETELLAVRARDLWLQQGRPRQGGRLVDVGTGSGCIPITVERELALRGITIMALGVDVSPSALAVARENANQLRSAAQFQKLDLFQAASTAFEQLEMLVSNPPYIPERERDELRRQVHDHEPGLALFVPDEDPLLFYRYLAQRARDWLAPGGSLLVESHAEHAPGVAALFTAHGLAEVQVQRDLAGRDRLVEARQEA